MKRILVVALMMAPVALAQPAPPIASPPSVGKPHICLEYYPQDAVAAGAQGTTPLSYHITVEGTVADLAIAKSSGNESLDYAALVCASAWRYQPAMENGKPVEVPWKAEVRWLLHRPGEPRPSIFDAVARACVRNSHVTPARLAALSGPTVLSVTIAKGEVTDAKLVRSSGDDALDADAVKCVRALRIVGPEVRPEGAAHIVAIPWQDAAPAAGP